MERPHTHRSGRRYYRDEGEGLIRTDGRIAHCDARPHASLLVAEREGFSGPTGTTIPGSATARSLI